MKLFLSKKESGHFRLVAGILHLVTAVISPKLYTLRLLIQTVSVDA